MVKPELSVPEEVFRTVREQLTDKTFENILMVSKKPVESALLDRIRTILGAKQAKVLSADGFNGQIPEATVDLLLFNGVATDKTTHAILPQILESSLRVLKKNGAAVFYELLDQVEPIQVAQLSTLFDSAQANKDDPKSRSFKLLCMNQTTEAQPRGLFWLLETHAGDAGDQEQLLFRSFLDHTQYEPHNIEAYEWIFGQEFISPGGPNMNRRLFCQFDDLEEGKRLLDIGSGLGGGARQVARELGLRVSAVDISANMMALSLRRHRQRPVEGVSYMLADVMRYRWAPEAFHYVFTRDCIQHIADLDQLLAKVWAALKPGGQLIVTMYGRGEGPFIQEFTDFVKSRRYFLRTLDEMEAKAKNAGFSQVEAQNITPTFEQILKKELQRALDNKDDFLKHFSAAKYESLLSGWRQKLEFIKHDNHNWLFLKCTK